MEEAFRRGEVSEFKNRAWLVRLSDQAKIVCYEFKVKDGNNPENKIK
jgi:hypothetical protein